MKLVININEGGRWFTLFWGPSLFHIYLFGWSWHRSLHSCENCRKSNASIRWTDHPRVFFCSQECLQETEEFYAAGCHGFYGHTTKEAKACRAKQVKGDPCYCWTSKQNRIHYHLPVVHSADCPNHEPGTQRQGVRCRSASDIGD